MSAEKLAALELEHRLAAAEARIIELESQLRVAVECIEFYADKYNWNYADNPYLDDKISVADVERFEHESVAGKLARETLKKLIGVKPE